MGTAVQIHHLKSCLRPPPAETQAGCQVELHCLHDCNIIWYERNYISTLMNDKSYIVRWVNTCNLLFVVYYKQVHAASVLKAFCSLSFLHLSIAAPDLDRPVFTRPFLLASNLVYLDTFSLFYVQCCTNGAPLFNIWQPEILRIWNHHWPKKKTFLPLKAF